MAIKKLKVSFEIDMETFARVLAYGSNEMNIQVYGTDGPEQVSHTSLPRVTHTGGEHPASRQMIVLEALSSGKKTLNQLNEAVVQVGFKPSLNSCLHEMLKTKVISRVAYATYAITGKGRAYVSSQAI